MNKFSQILFTTVLLVLIVHFAISSTNGQTSCTWANGCSGNCQTFSCGFATQQSDCVCPALPKLFGELGLSGANRRQDQQAP
ncbi:hypothetical protein niasHT_008639 [Heterodera trifolii]|uniref:Uncharacterized protein n=1 Tax=Heterodera trifolii TaxID=157864 RepID=A0ABD2LW22_9BILA